MPNPNATPINANGHAWRMARARVLRAQTHCAICGQWIDKTLATPHPDSAEIDHIIPVSRGGHRTNRANLQLTCRRCNRAKGDGTGQRAASSVSYFDPSHVVYCYGCRINQPHLRGW